MMRFSGLILCLTALIAQIGMGCLPPGEICLGCTAPRETRSCCCCCKRGQGLEGTMPCCRRGAGRVGVGGGGGVAGVADLGGPLRGCDRCILVNMPDGSATTTARLQFDRGVDWPAADLPCAALPCPAPMPPRNAFAPPRATESPPRPGLLVVRTTCLVL